MPIINNQPLPEKKTLFGSQGLREFANLQRRRRSVGQSNITIFPGDNIQEAVNKLGDDKGGIVFLKTGTHTVTSSITLPKSIQIIGESSEGTVIDFNSTSSQFIVAGTDAYTTGTISSIGSGGIAV